MVTLGDADSDNESFFSAKSDPLEAEEFVSLSPAWDLYRLLILSDSVRRHLGSCVCFSSCTVRRTVAIGCGRLSAKRLCVPVSCQRASTVTRSNLCLIFRFQGFHRSYLQRFETSTGLSEATVAGTMQGFPNLSCIFFLFLLTGLSFPYTNSFPFSTFLPFENFHWRNRKLLASCSSCLKSSR